MLETNIKVIKIHWNSVVTVFWPFITVYERPKHSNVRFKTISRFNTHNESAIQRENVNTT